MTMNVKEIEQKIESIETPKVKKVASAFSGGLDSCLGIALLRKKYKAEEIVAVNINIGQGDDEVEMARRHAKVLGLDMVTVDVRKEFADEWVKMAIKANSSYEGYPVSTSMTRQLVARKVAEVAVKRGCDAVIEGSSGKGNDQYRMHNTFTLFAPGCKVLVPVRDFDLTRLEEEVLCKAWDIPVAETITGGDDKTLWCRSIASGAIDLNQVVPKDIWMWLTIPEDAPDKATEMEIEFADGIPVKLDGKAMDLADLIDQLNRVAGKNGLGRIDMFEDGIMNLKSREVYEAPAAEVILKLHHDLEQYCLTKDELFFKQMVDSRWAYLMYHGEAYTPLRYELEAFINESQKNVSGKYRVKLYKGTCEITGRESKTGLFFPEIRSIKATGFDQRQCADAAFVRGLQFVVLAKREQKAAETGKKTKKTK